MGNNKISYKARAVLILGVLFMITGLAAFYCRLFLLFQQYHLRALAVVQLLLGFLLTAGGLILTCGGVISQTEELAESRKKTNLVKIFHYLGLFFLVQSLIYFYFYVFRWFPYLDWTAVSLLNLLLGLAFIALSQVLIAAG